MTKLALFGAGGKMGLHLSRNLATSDFETAHVEASEVGQNSLRDELGIECVDSDIALKGTEVIVLTVPDKAIGEITPTIINKVKSGAMIVCLDAAAPFAGHLTDRKDVGYFVLPSPNIQ